MTSKLSAAIWTAGQSWGPAIRKEQLVREQTTDVKVNEWQVKDGGNGMQEGGWVESERETIEQG